MTPEEHARKLAWKDGVRLTDIATAIREAVAAERDRCANICRNQIKIYRSNAALLPGRATEFNQLAESAACIEAVILDRYDPHGGRPRT